MIGRAGTLALFSVALFAATAIVNLFSRQVWPAAWAGSLGTMLNASLLAALSGLALAGVLFVIGHWVDRT